MCVGKMDQMPIPAPQEGNERACEGGSQGFSLIFGANKNQPPAAMAKRPILVPTDFSEVADTALNHAVMLGKRAETDVYLAHIVEDKKNVDEGRKKLQKAKEEIQKEDNFEIKTLVRVGDILEDIGDLASELDAALVVMGTKGLRGLQWITGGGALRVVTGSKVPYIITQKKKIGPEGYDDILVPLDLHKETKQKLSLVADASVYFDSRVHILVPKERDEFLRNKLERNMKYASRFFEDKGIPYTTKISEYDSDDFDDGIIAYAKEIDVDLISIMNIPGISLLNLIGGNFVQNVITNDAQIPVLVLNPKEITHINIFGAYMGR